MNPWPFIIAAYGLALLGTAALVLASWRAMRAAERAVDRLSDKP
ncbi:MAG: heme exporter protein CcmD [Sphingobium sp.]